MLEQFLTSTHGRKKLNDGPFAEVLEPLAEQLIQQGYSLATGRTWFRHIFRFHQWFRKKGFPDDSLERQHVDQYLAERPQRPPNSKGRRDNQDGRRTVFPVVLALLEEKRLGRTGTPITKTPSALDGFEEHLRDNCALSSACIRYYLRWIKRLNEFVYGSPDVTWQPLKPSVLLDFIQHTVQVRKLVSCSSLVSALRSYFRYLQFCGHDVKALLDTVPRIKRFSRPLPERILTAEQQKLWVNGIDRSTAEGRRDYAMVLCLCDLGLRVGDLALLTLDDLDWHKGAIRIPNNKRKRPYWLPLPSRVGKAIAAYLKRDRPKTDRRELFLRHRPPHALPLNTWNIQARLQRVAKAQGLPQPLTGTHALRHTIATRAYEQGTSLKEVADILGHDDIRSTVIYAKTNRQELAEIALPWPEVQS